MSPARDGRIMFGVSVPIAIRKLLLIMTAFEKAEKKDPRGTQGEIVSKALTAYARRHHPDAFKRI